MAIKRMVTDVVPIENEKNLRKSHENNPVAIRLMANKGHDIEKVYTIDRESAPHPNSHSFPSRIS
jgi:hypothetical protein